MSEIQSKHYSQIKSLIERNQWSHSEKPESGCKRIDVKNGKFSAVVKIYETGTIQVQGAESNLKESLLKAKEAIENGENTENILPFEIERFPEILQERIPAIDPVIVRFIKEAIITVKSGSNLGCAFLLGGASEKESDLFAH
jgi:hypothetical protein